MSGNKNYMQIVIKQISMTCSVRKLLDFSLSKSSSKTPPKAAAKQGGITDSYTRLFLRQYVALDLYCSLGKHANLELKKPLGLLSVGIKIKMCPPKFGPLKVHT